jgi:hypothetical protein
MKNTLKKNSSLTEKVAGALVLMPVVFFALPAAAGGPAPVPPLPAGVTESQAQYLQQQTQQSNVENQQMQHNITQAGQLQNSKMQSAGLPISGFANMQVASDKANAAIEACAAKRLSGVLKSYIASAKCSNPKIISLFKHASYPYMDLIKDFTDKRLSVAYKLDKNIINEDEAKTEIIDYLNYIVQEERNRIIKADDN